MAVAESLTSGRIASALGAGSDASEWFAGGIVAYASDVKFELLGVEPGPVINPACARQLAQGAAKLLDAHLSIGVTGCGGPNPEEGQPPGTVFIATQFEGAYVNRAFEFDGPPDRVLEQTTRQALVLLDEATNSIPTD